MKMRIPCDEGCSRAGAGGGDPDVVGGNWGFLATQVGNNLAEDDGDIAVDGQDFDDRHREEFVELRQVLRNPGALGKARTEFTNHNCRKADPFGRVEEGDNSRLPSLEMAVGDCVETVAAHFQSP